MRKSANKSKASRLLRKLLENTVKQAPLFGDRIAQEAKQHGVHLAHVGDSVESIRGGGRLLERLLQSPNLKRQVSNQVSDRVVLPPRGVFVDYADSTLSPKSMRTSNAIRVGQPMKRIKLEEIASDKAQEAAAFPELLPRTVVLSDLAKRHKIRAADHDKILEAVRKEVGDKFIIKPREGYGTAANQLVTESNAPTRFVELRTRGLPNAQGVTFKGALTRLIAQPRLDLAPIGRLDRAANNITEIVQQGKLKELMKTDRKGLLRALVGGNSPVPAKGSVSGGSSKEFRVHVVDGKVIPYATSMRGSVLGTLPIRTFSQRAAEKAVADKLKAMDPERLKGPWAFDVAKGRGKDKGWHVIETNPVFEGGSGLMALPHIRDALAAAIEGRLPRYVLAQRAALGTGATGATGATALTARRLLGDESDEAAD